MLKPKIKSKRGPERIIQDAVIALFRTKEWYVKETHGNMYQSGFPDLFCCHKRFGIRMVEIKNPLAYSFTGAQLECFPLFCANGCGIWIMTAATEDQYLKVLKGPPNWWQFIK